MNFTRPRVSDWVTALCGLVLLISLSRPWYRGYGVSLGGFEVSGFTAAVLGLLAVLAIALPLVTAARATPAVPVALNVVTVALAIPAIILVLLALATIDWPAGRDIPVAVPVSPGDSGPPVPDGRRWGIWLALGATLATFYAAYRALRDERAPGILPAPEPARMPPPAASLAADAQP